MRERRNFITVIKGLKDLLDLMKRAFHYTASARTAGNENGFLFYSIRAFTGQSFNQVNQGSDRCLMVHLPVKSAVQQEERKAMVPSVDCSLFDFEYLNCCVTFFCLPGLTLSAVNSSPVGPSLILEV